MTEETDAPQAKPKATSAANALTLRLGPDSKMSLPIQGGNLLVMAAILFKMFTSFAALPDNVDAIAKDMTTIKGDIDQLKTQGVDLATKNGELEVRMSLIEKATIKATVARAGTERRVDDLEERADDLEERADELETQNEKLEVCIRKPSKCRL